MVSSYEVFRTLLICAVLFILTYLFVINIISTSNFETKRETKFTIFQALLHDGTAALPLNSSITCPELPSTLLGAFRVSLAVPSEDDIVQANPNVKQGGWFQPEDCRARQKVAVIIPYRNRSEHLSVLLNNIHPFLQRQRFEYAIFVIEQADNLTFNRGKLMNAGFVEISKTANFDCFIFHDTDLLPENDRNLYSCATQPTLVSVAISSSQYKPMYGTYFGGVISITKEQFTAVNGYPNLYWGWGKEDDDLSERVRYRFGSIFRPHRAVGRFTMIPHDRDALNQPNVLGEYLSKAALSRAPEDGLNSLYYRVVRIEKRALYTWILVDVGQPPAVVRLVDGKVGLVDHGKVFQLDRCIWNEKDNIFCKS